MKRGIYNRITNGAEIEEVWIRDGKHIYPLYIKSEG